MSHISLNIKRLRMSEKLSQTAFGELFGLTRGQVAAYEAGSTPALDVIVSIADHFNIDLRSFIVGDSYNYVDIIDTPSQHREDFMVYEPPEDYIHSHVGIKFIDNMAMAGWPSHVKDSEWFFSAPTVQIPGPIYASEGVHVCVQIFGSSMEPTLRNGDYIVAHQVNHPKYLRPGEVYVFVLRDGPIVKRLSGRPNGTVKMVSDNLDYGVMEYDASEVLQAWYVKARISYDISPGKI